MQNDAKVVQLNPPKVEPTAKSPARGLPAVLLRVRDQALDRLGKALQSLFDRIDDTLFQMADRAIGHQEQNDLFAVVRELRLQRKNIERAFLRSYLQSFASLTEEDSGTNLGLESISFEEMSLLDTDAHEETVAVDAMVAKLLSNDGIALGHLTSRINWLLHCRHDDRRNPLGPVLLCSAFSSACATLEMPIAIKLVVLKLFDKHVLGAMAEVYAESNQIMIREGVLPDLKASTRSRAIISSENPAVTDTPAAPLEADVRQVFGELQELLANVRSSGLGQTQVPADALPISSNDLLRLLSHMQRKAELAGEPAGLRDNLDQLIQHVGSKSGKARRLGQVDDDVINLVSMLFEFILDDKALPDSLKAIIARMQIPMLKVAVQDKTFFSRGGHPARRLLNEIAYAALGWAEQDEARRGSLFIKIDHTVKRLLNEYVDDPLIFSELLADFTAFCAEERRRSEMLEQRTRESEEGLARTALARQQVEQTLNQHLLGKVLPAVVLRMLTEQWSKVLLLVGLKYGVQSQAWNSAVLAMDDLIWSVEAHSDDPHAGERLNVMLPQLLASLRSGLESAAIDPFVCGEFFSQLAILHRQATQPSMPQELPAALPSAEQEAPAAPSVQLPAAETDAFRLTVIEEILPQRAAEPRPAVAVSLADDDEHLLRVDSLRAGSWMEFLLDDGQKHRCKLAAIIKSTAKYIFVNRTGMKMAEKTRMELAMEFRAGTLRVLEDALLFDRALEAVVASLQRHSPRD